MQPKLKENPREWQKFAAVLAVMLGLVTWLASRRGWLPRGAWIPIGIALLLIPVLALIRPRWFRPIYRGGMTVSFHIGHVMGKIMLTLFFLLVMTPLGLFLRLLGKDLLAMRRRPDAATYWHQAKPASKLDQMF
jgi:hypothetical protein